MPDFKAKMHQILFRLGRPRWGAYSAPPDPLAGCKGPTTKGEGRGREGGARGGELTAVAVVMFSHSGKSTGIVIITARYLKHPARWKNCTKFGQFILNKIIKIVASRCQILRLNPFVTAAYPSPILQA